MVIEAGWGVGEALETEHRSTTLSDVRVRVARVTGRGGRALGHKDPGEAGRTDIGL